MLLDDLHNLLVFVILKLFQIVFPLYVIHHSLVFLDDLNTKSYDKKLCNDIWFTLSHESHLFVLLWFECKDIVVVRYFLLFFLIFKSNMSK